MHTHTGMHTYTYAHIVFTCLSHIPHSQVNSQDMTNVTDEVAMSILRSSPRRLSLILGRAVTNLIAPPFPDSLQDIILYKTPTGQLGKTLNGSMTISIYQIGELYYRKPV